MKMFRGAAVAAAIAGSMVAYNAQAVNLATDGIGEVAIAPYYTTRDGWITAINLTNVTLQPLAVKIRLHEARNSRDVLDFVVAMSANDVFTAVIQDNGDGPKLFVRDDRDVNDLQTCTVPTTVASNSYDENGPGTSLLTGAYGPADSVNDDGGPLGTDRHAEGYIEFIVMGYAEGGKDPVANPVIGANDIINMGNAIEQHDCANIQRGFSNLENGTTTERRILETARQFGEPINALKFNFRLLNPAMGVEAGAVASTWANFYNPAAAFDGQVAPADNADCEITRGDQRETAVVTAFTDWVPDGSDETAAGLADGSCRNLITAQTPNAFLEPSIADAFPEVGNWWDDAADIAVSATPAISTPTTAGGAAADYNAPNNVRGVDAVSATIMRDSITNEWASDLTGSLGERTDWVITMPTKSFYVDGSSTYVDDGTLGVDGVAGQQAGVTPLFANDGNGGANGIEGLYTGLDTARPESILDAVYGTASANAVGTLPPYKPFTNAFAQTTPGDRTTAESCQQIGFAVYDRAEQFLGDIDPGDGVVVSPGTAEPVDQIDICYEANVVTFNGSSVLGSEMTMNITTDGSDGNPAPLTNKRGWMRFNLDTDADAYLELTGFGNIEVDGDNVIVDNAGGGVGTAATALRGLPVIGTMVKMRTFGSVTKNYASGTDHSYTRQYSADVD